MLTSFKIRPHSRSPRYTSVKVFKTVGEWKAELLRVEGPSCPLLDSKYEACHVGRMKRAELGIIYLVHGESFLRIAVHELLHASIYYVSEARRHTFANFLTPAGEMVSDTEELVAETLEAYFQSFQDAWTRRLPRIKKLL